MIWGPADWDHWTLDAAAQDTGRPARVAAVCACLEGLPGRRSMTAADLGCGTGELLPFLASRFRRVVAVDYAPAALARARREHAAENVVFRRRDLRDLTPLRRSLGVAVAVDSILGPRPEDVDRILDQVRRCLVEGGLLVATFPARSRTGEPFPFSLRGPESEEALVPGFHETEVQYRLRRAGFQGVRLRRLLGGDGAGEALLCLAARRASN